MDKWKDISSEFDAVKDTKTQGWQKQKKFSEIFSNAYHLDPLIASKMWQYVIDTHENDRDFAEHSQSAFGYFSTGDPGEGKCAEPVTGHRGYELDRHSKNSKNGSASAKKQ